MAEEAPSVVDPPERRRRAGRVAAHHRDTAITVAGSFAVQLVALISGVLVARLLGVENRGRAALLVLVALVIAQLGTLGLPLALTYWIARDPAVERPLVASLRRVFLGQIAVGAAIQCAVLYLVVGLGVAAFWIAGLVSVLAMPGLFAVQYSLALLQAQGRFRAFSAVRLLAPCVYSLGLVVVAVIGRGGLVAIMAIWVGSAALTGATGLILTLGRRPGASGREPESRAPGMRPMLSFGLRGFLGSISPLDAFQLDQAIVGLFVSPAALGVYVVGVGFANLPRFAAQSIGIVAYPHIAGKGGAAGVRRETWRFVALTLLVCGPIVAVLEIAMPTIVPLLFGHAFDAATGLARILLLAALLVGLRRVMSDCARGGGHPTLGTAAEVVATAALPVGAGLLAGDGARGVSWALVASGALGLAVLMVGFLATPDRPPPPPLPPPDGGPPPQAHPPPSLEDPAALVAFGHAGGGRGAASAGAGRAPDGNDRLDDGPGAS
ncbi:MAG: hypothetical protein QOF77_1563 [Solirubrobacteraceae bacterium]|nr:hypothetical protein [Solirubrobacteraceae bacterium]